MKTLTVLEPEKLTAEEVAALKRVGFHVEQSELEPLVRYIGPPVLTLKAMEKIIQDEKPRAVSSAVPHY